MRQFVDNLTPCIDNFLQHVHSKQVDWENKPARNKWSNKEIIGHLCDSAMINLQRFIRCTYEENFKLIYHQDEWVAVQHYQEMKVETLLEFWRLLNSQITRVLSQYPEDRWAVKCDSGRSTVTLHTVEFLAQDYVNHLQHHLNQIKL